MNKQHTANNKQHNKYHQLRRASNKNNSNNMFSNIDWPNKKLHLISIASKSRFTKNKNKQQQQQTKQRRQQQRRRQLLQQQ